MNPDPTKSSASTAGINVIPNDSAPFAVRLSRAAPAGGVTVILKSSDTSKVTVTPASVLIPSGATTPPTQPQVSGTGIGSATISAEAPGYISGAGAVTVTAPTLAFSGSPLVITTGGTGNLMLNLMGGRAPAGGLTVNLTSSDASKVKVPGAVSFAPGATTATIPVTPVAGGTVTITASATDIASAIANVAVTSVPTVIASYGANFIQVINLILTNTSTVTAVNVVITSLTVTAPAPNVITVFPPNAIPAPYGNLVGGQVEVRVWRFNATAGSIAVPFTLKITYQADNMPPQTAVIDVPFPRAMNFSGGPLTINPGASGDLTLKLLGNQAPAGGLIVSLTSSDPNLATVPATVTFPPGATTVAVPVTALAGRGPLASRIQLGSVVITASATVVNFPATAIATVNIGGRT